MHLNLQNPSQPIKEMDPFELPEFAVLIGRNGIGKTQLLSAIANGTVKVDGISPEFIERYDTDSFRPWDSGPGGWNDSAFFHQTVNRFLYSNSGRPLVEVAKETFDHVLEKWDLAADQQAYRQFVSSVRSHFNQIPDFDTMHGMNQESAAADYVNAIFGEVIGELVPRGRNRRRDGPGEIRSFNDNPAALVCHAMKIHEKFPHELTRNDLLIASHYEGGTITNQISQIFSRFKSEQYAWAHDESERCERSIRELLEEYTQEHVPPWMSLRSHLDQLRDASDDPNLFNFDFTDPETDTLSYANHQQYSFQTRFINRATGDSYSVEDLSSGEKILLSLCLAAFNKSMGKRWPRLVLLDELDALLHPSMISVLIAGLKAQFVQQGTPVIIATHSVTTASLLEEGEIFQLTRSGPKLRVLPVTRSEAVVELSEGLATIEEGLRIAAADSVAQLIILSEGNNALHLQRWAKLAFGNKVSVFDKLRDRTGKNELCSYARLLAKVRTNTCFLIVFDCDATKEARVLKQEIGEAENVRVFALPKKENTIAKNGIENNFPERFLEEFKVTSTSERTGKTTVSMSNEEKKAFAEHINSKGTKDHFKYFDELEETVCQLLEDKGSSREAK